MRVQYGMVPLWHPVLCDDIWGKCPVPCLCFWVPPLLASGHFGHLLPQKQSWKVFCPSKDQENDDKKFAPNHPGKPLHPLPPSNRRIVFYKGASLRPRATRESSWNSWSPDLSMSVPRTSRNTSSGTTAWHHLYCCNSCCVTSHTVSWLNSKVTFFRSKAPLNWEVKNA